MLYDHSNTLFVPFIATRLNMLLSASSGSEAETISSIKSPASSMSRTSSIPVNFESSMDTVRLAEVFVAAEHALHKTISDPGLWKSLSSLEEFEVYATSQYQN